MTKIRHSATDGQAFDYISAYIKRAIKEDELATPVKAECGSYYEALYSLYEAHAQGGAQAARQVWEEVIKVQRPALAELDPDTPLASYKPDDDMIAQELAKQIEGQASYFYSQWRIYDAGCWRVQDEPEFRRFIRTALRSFRGRGIAVNQNRIIALAKMLADDLFIKDREVIERQREQAKYINLRNGLFNLDTMELEPHRRDLYFTTQLDFDYDPSAYVDTFRKYLNSSLVLPTDKSQTDESLVDLLLEILGYCFTARTDLKASFWLYGGKDTGKSTFITLLKSLMGDLYTTIDLTQLGTNRFLLAGMVGKRVIGFAEGENNTVLPDALYKTLTGGSDEIFADVKNRNPITFRMEGKIVWAMNNLPRISDRTGATTRRVYLVPYNRTIPEKDRIHNLEARLMLERPGIFNLAMDHLRDLTERGSFIPCAQSEHFKQEYISQNDTEQTFVDEMCEIGENFSVAAGAFYDAYKFFCDRFGFQAKNMNKVADDWRRMLFVQKKSSGNFWHGVRLKPINNVTTELLPKK